LAGLRQRSAGHGHDPVAAIVSALQDKARALAGLAEANGTEIGNGGGAGKAPEVPALAIPKEKRLRDKGHLAFVAGQPCLVCGRRPAQAHHLRFAQGRAMGLKVSDEFTVPLCNAHHDSVHRTGEEQAWWARHGILDPLKFAARLWAASRQAGAGAEAETLPLTPADDPAAPPAPANGSAATS
jgi:Protein of unknown function (DUF968)